MRLCGSARFLPVAPWKIGGCITFREQALLVDPENTSLPTKQYVANVVAHELTHQWFGNLVTMRWWNDPVAERKFCQLDELSGG